MRIKEKRSAITDWRKTKRQTLTRPSEWSSKHARFAKRRQNKRKVAAKFCQWPSLGFLRSSRRILSVSPLDKVDAAAPRKAALATRVNRRCEPIAFTRLCLRYLTPRILLRKHPTTRYTVGRLRGSELSCRPRSRNFEARAAETRETRETRRYFFFFLIFPKCVRKRTLCWTLQQIFRIFRCRFFVQLCQIYASLQYCICSNNLHYHYMQKVRYYLRM